MTHKNTTVIPNPRVDTTPVRFNLVQSLGDILYVYLFLRNLTIKSGSDPNSGRNILDAARSEEITDKTAKIKFNEDGDRLMYFYVWSLSSNASTYTPYMEINLTADNKYSVVGCFVVLINW
ncbi:hypothetical protein HELRODRAFT_163855 [Helobdella robusta]|uniref:Uncharacterized protein n=1 Tax=Helobdella robusta TaxID=6412 RepID=T1EUJ5_HELRO|nr:hypothetical protein HELRODRAFT_163855 [Helobdella robusta]ESN96745.1 hypothetical protein HELRODRAFT_163855 [Helobdella robusta]